MMEEKQQIKQKLQQILDRQYADGEARQNREGSIWGGSGGDVKRAVAYASDAIRDPLSQETAQQYLQALIVNIEKEQSRYREIEEDKEGYGKATFIEILRDSQALLARLSR